MVSGRVPAEAELESVLFDLAESASAGHRGPLPALAGSPSMAATSISSKPEYPAAARPYSVGPPRTLV